MRTRAGTWRPLHSVLLAGEIVPGNRSRDDDATVDIRFHVLDDELLRGFGLTEEPHESCDLSVEPQFALYRNSCRRRFREQEGLPHTPGWRCLNFTSRTGAGPLEVLAVLSDEGGALYTDALLNLEAAFEPWTMRHTGTNQQSYPKMSCESLAIHVLREYGRIRTSHGTVPLGDALGPRPKRRDALHTLLVHPMSDKIKAAFDLAEPMPEFFWEDDPIPLTDIWPELEQYLPAHRKTCRLVRSERILVLGQSQECVFHSPDVYLAGTVDDDERCKLRLVSDELELGLSLQLLDAILQRRTAQEIEERRAVIRQHPTAAKRLLAAVGEQELRKGLPGSLVAVLETIDA